MLRLWETIGQALCDTNFRQDRILLGNDKALPKDYLGEDLQVRVNEIPERHSLSRFEVGEVRRLFGIPQVVSGIVKVCKHGADDAVGHVLTQQRCETFLSRGWCKRRLGQRAFIHRIKHRHQKCRRNKLSRRLPRCWATVRLGRFL